MGGGGGGGGENGGYYVDVSFSSSLARLPVQDSLLKINLVDLFVYFCNLVRGVEGGRRGEEGEEGVEGGGGSVRGGGGGAAVTMNTMKMFCNTR